MKRPVQFLPVAMACLAAPINCALAKSPGDYWQDTRDYVTAPMRWDSSDWAVAGGVVLGIAAAYSIDGSVHDHVGPDGPVNAGARARRDAIPLAAMLAGTFAVGALAADRQLIGTGWDMGEAVVLGSLSAHVLKFAFGRARPSQSTSPHRFGKGGDSFPSGHTTAAFAAAQVLADELPGEQWGWRMLAYGLAGATAYARMDSNAHWLSDTVAGAALGIASGRFVANRRQDHAPRISLSVAPTNHGAMVAFAIDVN